MKRRAQHLTSTKVPRLTELEQTVIERTQRLLEFADVKNLGALDTALLQKFFESADRVCEFAGKFLASPKGD